MNRTYETEAAMMDAYDNAGSDTMPLARIVDKVECLTKDMEELRAMLGTHADRVWGEQPEICKVSELDQVAGGGAMGELENAVNRAKRAFNLLREQGHRNCGLA